MKVGQCIRIALDFFPELANEKIVVVVVVVVFGGHFRVIKGVRIRHITKEKLFPPSSDEWVLVLMTLSRPSSSFLPPRLPRPLSRLKMMTPLAFPASILT